LTLVPDEHIRYFYCRAKILWNEICMAQLGSASGDNVSLLSGVITPLRMGISMLDSGLFLLLFGRICSSFVETHTMVPGFSLVVLRM